MEPILRIESHPKALHYEDHLQQIKHETQSDAQETASTADTAEQGVTTVNKATDVPETDTAELGVATVNKVTDEPNTNNTVEQEMVNTKETNNIKAETSNKIMPGKRQDHEAEDNTTFNSPGSGDKNKITLSISDFRIDLENQDLERQAVNRATIETVSYTHLRAHET